MPSLQKKTFGKRHISAKPHHPRLPGPWGRSLATARRESLQGAVQRTPDKRRRHLLSPGFRLSRGVPNRRGFRVRTPGGEAGPSANGALRRAPEKADGHSPAARPLGQRAEARMVGIRIVPRAKKILSNVGVRGKPFLAPACCSYDRGKARKRRP